MDDGFIDLQVNGYAGIDFNSDDVTPTDYHTACERLKADGNAGILATIITDELDRMEHRLANIVRARAEDPDVAKMIFGIHIEGPFLNETAGYIGAHPAHAAEPANTDGMKRLLEAADGLTKIVTLAPERDADFNVTRMLAEQKITVSAGHCNPEFDQLQAAIDAGLSMFTHLGNGCPLMMHRHDNIIQRVLNLSDRLRVGFIADGVHVPFVALKNYIQSVGFERSFVVTDAIAAAGQGPGTYVLAGHTVVVDDSLATWAEDKSHLVGSASTMVRVEQNLRQHLNFSDEQVLKLTRQNPRNAIVT